MMTTFSLRRALAALAFLSSLGALAHCGGGPSYPACQEHKTVLSGTLDGAALDKTLDNQSVMLTQLGSPATLEIEWTDQGRLHLEWAGMAADGQEVQVTGKLKLGTDAERSVESGSTLVILADSGGYQLDLKVGTDEILACAN